MEAAAARSSTRGLSEFLVDHELHGQGFDVSHPDGLGNGRIEITCRGCGHSCTYAPGRVRVNGKSNWSRFARPPRPHPPPLLPPRRPRLPPSGPPPSRPGPKPAGKKKAKTKTKAPNGGPATRTGPSSAPWSPSRSLPSPSPPTGSPRTAPATRAPEPSRPPPPPRRRQRSRARQRRRLLDRRPQLLAPHPVEGKTALASPTGAATAGIVESTTPTSSGPPSPPAPPST